ncbi:MAG: hypothetical protein GF399_03895 [Candidatus Coatesbacteria bacterium]|nr:hypothetical protein [Candidatus Coatesbacteria bacterium]
MGKGIALTNGRLMPSAQGGLACYDAMTLVRARIARMLRARRGELESHPDWGNPLLERLSAPTDRETMVAWTDELRRLVGGDPAVREVMDLTIKRLGNRSWFINIVFIPHDLSEQQMEIMLV